MTRRLYLRWPVMVMHNRERQRGIEAADYMAGNLLKQEVEARHVAEAFLMLGQMERTTGHVVTVDGGNVEASLR